SQQRRTLLGSTLPLFLLLCSLSCAKPPDKPHPAPKKTPVTKKTAKIVAEDGPTTLDPGSNLVNGYSALTANVTAGATSLTVDDVSDLAVPGLGPLAAGDLILIYQPQGAAISTLDGPDYGAVTELGSSGRYELVEVNDVSGDTIGLSCATQSAYSSTGNAQVVRVPQYSTLTIPAGATLTGSAWDGSAGGVVAVHAESLVLDGSIDASALGFRGGAVDNMSTAGATNTTSYVATQQTAGGQKGESIAGSPSFYQNDLNGAYGRGAPANAGGGGNAHNAGGGGGAGANNGAIWTGQGVMLSSVVGPEAWLLDPGFLANGGSLTTSSGGGRGGYTYASDNENALLVAPESAAWGGNLGRGRGGLGGHPLDAEVDGRLFFGGGGGAGDGNNGGAGAGGRGGGLVIVIAGSISGAGSIVASGSAGGNTTA